jgi:hypothetical protein
MERIDIRWSARCQYLCRPPKEMEPGPLPRYTAATVEMYVYLVEPAAGDAAGIVNHRCTSD